MSKGRTLGERLAEKIDWTDRKVIREFSNPVSPVGGLIALKGNSGGRMARSSSAPAATASLFEHEGRAVVFENLEDLAGRIDDPKLDVTADDILVLKNAGPKAAQHAGGPVIFRFPKKLAQQGVKDMVRISDARMSGTAFGTVVLHVAPEAAVGGPLAAVRNGDRIRLSVADKRIELLVSPEELQQRLAGQVPAQATAAWLRGALLSECYPGAPGMRFSIFSGRAVIFMAQASDTSAKTALDTPALFARPGCAGSQYRAYRANLPGAWGRSGGRISRATRRLKLPGSSWTRAPSASLCAKLGEAEVLAAAGIRDIMIANQIVGDIKIRRLMTLLDVGRSHCSGRWRGQCAKRWQRPPGKAEKILRVVIEVDTGMNRAGVAPGRAGAGRWRL